MNMWYINAMEYCSAIKMNSATCSKWMDLEIVILSEVSQMEKEKYYMISHMWNLKKWYKWTYLQNSNRLTDLKKELMVTRGQG